MKFFCDGCNAKYSIADEKVRGKVVKVRCKRCDQIIEVSETMQHDGRSGSPAGGSSAQPSRKPNETEQWYYSVDGETFGPLPEAELVGKYRAGELTGASYVWKDGFGDWQPASGVEPFQSALRDSNPSPASAPPERRNTIGVGGEEVESIETADARESGAAEEATGRRSVSEPGPRRADDRQAEAQGEGDRKERLNRLRNKLKSNFAGSEAKDGGEETEKADEGEPLRDEQDDEPGEAFGDEIDLEEESPGEEDDFELPPAGSGRLDDEHEQERDEAGEPEDHAGLFDSLGESEQEDREDEKADLPTAPKLSGEADEKTSGSFAEGVTESLLIQLDKIQDEGKGKRRVKIIAAVVLMVGAAGAWYYVWSTSKPDDDLKVESGTDRVVTEQDEGPLEKTYSKKERQRILTISPQKVEKGGEAEKKTVQANERAEKKATGNTDESPEMKLAERDRKPSGSKEAGVDLLERGAAASAGSDEESFESAFAGAKKRSANDDEGPDKEEKGLVRKMDDSKAIASSSGIGSSPSFGTSAEIAAVETIQGSSANVRQAQNSNDKGGNLRAKLDKEGIMKGINSIRQSVGTCRQRQARRGVPVEVGKVYLTAHVQPDGSVSSFSLTPSTFEDSIFKQCLTGHMSRWRFGTFKGAMQKLKAPFILQ